MRPLGINFIEILIETLIIQENAIENVIWEMAAILSGGDELIWVSEVYPVFQQSTRCPLWFAEVSYADACLMFLYISS